MPMYREVTETAAMNADQPGSATTEAYPRDRPYPSMLTVALCRPVMTTGTETEIGGRGVEEEEVPM